MTEVEKTHSYKKETAQPRVVIVGGGFGGLCAARGLAGALVSAATDETYREIPEIVAELRSLEQKATKITKELNGILHQLKLK